MTLSIWVPESWQIGQVAPGEARRGVMQRTVMQSIIRQLFDETNNAGSGRPSCDQMLIAFTKQLREFSATQPAVRDLWQVIFADEDVAKAKLVDSDAEQVPESFKAAFCLVVQGLCQAIAKQSLDLPDEVFTTEPNSDEDEVVENDEDDMEVAKSASQQIEYRQAAYVVTNLLRQAVWQWLRDYEANKEIKSDSLRLIAEAMLKSLLKVKTGWFKMKEKSKPDGQTDRSPNYILLTYHNLAKNIKKLVEALPYRYTLQPLSKPVRYEIDQRKSSSNVNENHFQVNLIGYKRTNTFLRELHAGAMKNDNIAPKFKQYVEAVNIQQAVPWRINLSVLKLAKHLTRIADDQDKWKEEIKQLIAGIDTAKLNDLRKWINKEFYKPEYSIERKRYERPGEFLDHILSRRVLDELGCIKADGTQAIFYLPWKADYRGRIYAETPWLTPQGGDVQRALFEFANGKPLDDQGIQAFCRHGANLVNREQILIDLDIKGRRKQVITLDERERWTRMHEKQILASAERPLQESFWRKVAAEPIQFLAFCFAYRQWKQNPQACIHLPVQIDGTCNGLQHIAAITCDEDLARAVNVLPNDDNLPSDIYSELAEAAAETLGQLGKLKKHGVYQQGLILADSWLADSLDRRCWLSRGTAKKVVMTIPYGAGQGAQASYVLDVIAEKLEKEWEKDRSIADELDQLISWEKEKDRRREFVTTCCKGQFATLRKKAFSGDEDARQEWNRLRTLAAYVSRAIVTHLRHALAKKYPCVDTFSNWLKDTADACAGMPLLWLSPLGFPVCQDKFIFKKTSMNARLGLGKEPFGIEIWRMLDVVNLSKEEIEDLRKKRKKIKKHEVKREDDQKQALLPNLIHSLDATHLAMTLRKAKDMGITDVGSIHDCLLCHPNDAVVLSQAVRYTFVRLYQRNSAGHVKPLALWFEWMRLVGELRELREPWHVLAALNIPGAYSENQLQNENEKTDFEVLEKIRQLEMPLLFFARVLLNYMESNKVDKGEKPSVLPLATGSLTLSNGIISEYFFS